MFVGENRGRIRVFDYEPPTEENPHLLVASKLGRGGVYRFFMGEVEPAASKLADDEIMITMVAPAGDPAFLTSLRYDGSGALSHALEASNTAFATPPTLARLDGEGDEEPTPYTQQGDVWVAPIPGTPGSGSALLTTVLDANEAPFPVVGDITVFRIDEDDTQWSSSVANLDLFIDPSATDLEELAIVSTEFPVPTAGLPDDVILAGPVHAFAGFPNTAVPNGRVQISYNADSLLASVPEAIVIYHWDGGQWARLETAVDISEQMATAAFDALGAYAVFLDLTQTTMVDVEEEGVPIEPDPNTVEPNYPNPFTHSTTIPFTLTEVERVRISVYDVLGRKVAVVVDRRYGVGRHEVIFDAHGLPPGVYFYQIRTASKRIVHKMMLLR